MKIERTYLNFTLTVSVLVALYLTSQNWKNQLVLDDVKVYNASLLTDSEVKTLADVQKGSSLYALSLTQISHRIEENPFVKKAVVVRALPYDLTVTVNERDPLALLATSSAMYSVDPDGVVLPLPLERKSNVPVITNVQSSLRVGDTVKGSLMQAVKFISGAGKMGPALSASIAEIRLEGDNLIAYTTASALPVIIGKGDLERKLVYLKEFLTEVATTGDPEYNYVDLRFNGQIVVGTETPASARLTSATAGSNGKIN